MVDRKLHRVQEVIFPVLREQLAENHPGLTVCSWVPDVDKRTYPILNVRRLGGLAKDMRRLDRAVIEITAYHRDGLIECDDLYHDARTVLWDMWEKQITTPAGSVSRIFETMGPTQFDSPFDDTWRVQGLIQLSIRPPRISN